MLELFKKGNYPILRPEKEEKKALIKINLQVSAEILIPVIIFFIAYFNSSWIQDYLYSEYPRGAGINSIILLWVIVLPLWALIVVLRTCIKRALRKKGSSE